MEGVILSVVSQSSFASRFAELIEFVQEVGSRYGLLLARPISIYVDKLLSVILSIFEVVEPIYQTNCATKWKLASVSVVCITNN